MFITALWKERTISLIPIHEKPDKNTKKEKRGKPPTIDFCFRAGWSKYLYFGVECKLIESNSKGLCDKYVQNGVMRYLDGRYGPKCSQGSMIGYIRQTDHRNVAKELRNRINELIGNPDFRMTDMIAFDKHYLSVHCRLKGLSPFLLHHLLFEFNCDN